MLRGAGDTTFTKISRWGGNSDINVDEIQVSSDHGVKTIKVREECKYNPHRITFKNKYGVMEDLWFFKKSVSSMSVEAEEFRANQFKQRSSGGRDRDAGLVRSSKEYGKNGTESITLNSGFVSEEAHNESFKQLMLSEEVQLLDSDNDVLRAVKISDSSLKIKTSVNDKLINYTIEVEFSNNIIDDVI